MTEETFVITFKGILFSLLGATEAERVYEEIKLHAENVDHNAILLNEDGGSFVSIEFIQDWDDEEN